MEDHNTLLMQQTEKDETIQTYKIGNITLSSK